MTDATPTAEDRAGGGGGRQPEGTVGETPKPLDGARAGLSARGARAVLLILTALAFVISLRAGLFWDDFIVIGPDKPIASPATILQAFSKRCALFPDNLYPYYRPLVDISLVLNYLVGGSHPFVYHATNYALHLANAAMSFGLFLGLLRGARGGHGGTRETAATGDMGLELEIRRDEGTCAASTLGSPPSPGEIVAALLGAGLFALHPIQCESVLWVAARPAMMSVFFCQLAALAAMRFVRGHGGESGARAALFAVAAAVGFVASLFSKEVAVTFVPAVAVFFLVKGRRPSRRALALYGALLLILAVYLAANRVETGYVTGTLSSRLERLVDTLVSSLGFYARLLAYPLDLYPYYMPGTAFGPWPYALGTAAIAAIGGATALLLWRRTPLAMTGLFGLTLFVGGAWLPMLGGQAILADRYLYQAMWGLGLVAAAAFAVADRRFVFAPSRLFLGVGLALCILTALSLRQSAFWIREDVMWSRALEIDPTNVRANYYLGEYFEGRGDLDRAAASHRAAAFESTRGRVEDRTNAAMALGHLMLARGRHAEALSAYQWAARFPISRGDAIVCAAIVDFERGAAASAWARLGEFRDDGRRRASTYLNLALIALRKTNDPTATAIWYEKARARGAAPNAEIESALRAAESSAKE